jgi:predicted phage tail protein
MLFLILVIAVIVIAFFVVGGGRRSRRMAQMTWDAMAPEQQARVIEAQQARSRNNAGLFLFLVAIVGVLLLIGQIAQMLGPATTPATAPATPNTQSAVTTQAPAEPRIPASSENAVPTQVPQRLDQTYCDGIDGKCDRKKPD